MREEIAYDERIDGYRVQLMRDGSFFVDGVERDRWMNEKTNKPWIPVKRKSFVSLAKQYLRD